MPKKETENKQQQYYLFNGLTLFVWELSLRLLQEWIDCTFQIVEERNWSEMEIVLVAITEIMLQQASQYCITFLQLSRCPTLAPPTTQPPTCAVTAIEPSPPQEISAVTNMAPAVCTVGSPCALESCPVISTLAPQKNEIKNLKISLNTREATVPKLAQRVQLQTSIRHACTTFKIF